MPKVSVVMPVYNGAKYLREAIESILKQTCKDFELIIVSEYGSNDKSNAIVDEYSCKDTRVVLLRNEEMRGISSSLNRGINYSKGEYVARMDADDVSLPCRLELQVNFMECNRDIAICGSEVEYINDKSVIRHGLQDNFPVGHEDIKAGLLFFCNIRHPTVMMRRQAIEEYGLRYNEEFKATEDFELWSRACHSVKFSNIKQVLIQYRFHEMNATNARKEEGIKNYIKVMEHSFKRLGIIFSDEELRLLCPLTCEFNESNKKLVMQALLNCADTIRKANIEHCIYDKASLDNALEIRLGWVKHVFRHNVVTLCREIADRIASQSPNSFNGRVVQILRKLADHLEVHGLISLIVRIFTFYPHIFLDRIKKMIKYTKKH